MLTAPFAGRAARRLGGIAAIGTMLGLGLAACSAGADTAPDPGAAASSSSGAQAGPSGTLNVYAAASLTKIFTELATQYEAAHPNATVSLNFDGSSTLATQIKEGAPADVFASADQSNMKKLSDAHLVQGSPVDFASNVLTLVVPPDNPAGIETFADAARPGIKLVICSPQVPCGAAGQADAASAGLALSPVSEELSVTSVLGKVISGEADAGLVYVTDAKAAGDKVRSIPLQLATPAVNFYPIAAVNASQVPELAQGFIDLVTGAQGQDMLSDAGFGKP